MKAISLMKLNMVLALLFLSASISISAIAQEEQKSEQAPEQAVAGLDHIGLTVLDLKASTMFFTEVLGFRLNGGDAEYPSSFLSNGQIFVTLWQTTNPSAAVKFDRKNNVGLHHLALTVTSFGALDQLYEKIQSWEGAEIEFSPELAYGGPAKHMMIREPSGNRIELVHRPE